MGQCGTCVKESKETCEDGSAATSLEEPAVTRTLTRVAGGHGGSSILKDFHGCPDRAGCVPEYIIKTYDEAEASAYRKLAASSDPLMRFTAGFGGEIDVQDREALAKELGMEGEARYMRLSNLLRGFKAKPHVMDCKIGTRSFREAECRNTALRPDLYARMVELDPQAPTATEEEAQACTKYRWMNFRDKCTNLDTLGFRIDGIASSKDVAKDVLEQARTLEAAAACIVQNFLPEPLMSQSGDKPGQDGCDTTLRQCRLKVAVKILSQLKELRTAMQQSAFVQSHEFVGTSLLFIADAQGPDGGAFLIDFAKVTPLPSGVTVDHQTRWVTGNYEDGLLTGMDNMIRCWERVAELVKEGSRSNSRLSECSTSAGSLPACSTSTGSLQA